VSIAVARLPGPVAFTASRISRRVADLADDLAADHPATPPALVALPGGERLAGELAELLAWPEPARLQLAAFVFGEHARVERDVDVPLAGRAVVVVEGIVDTGLTLRGALAALARHRPVALEACVLLDRPHRRLVDTLPIRHAGFRAPDRLLVGYGLSHRGRFAHLDELRVIEND
jgi:hypoxanthine phosphoribosyltransferase